MSKENIQKQILIRVPEDYHASIKSISDEENKSMNQFLVELIISHIDSYSDSEDDQNDSAVVDVLKDQIDKKDSQIEKLQELVARQQILTLNTQQEKKELLIELDETSTDEPDRPFWSRLFRS